MIWIALLIGLLAGAAVGLLAGRRRAAAEPVMEAVVPDPAVSADPLADEVERLRAAIDSLPIGCVVADADGHTRSNPAVGQFGASRHASLLIDDAVERQLRAALDGESGVAPIDLFGPPRRRIQVRSVPLDGGRAGAMATIEDVADRARIDSVRADFVANVSHELKTPVGAMVVLADALADIDDHDAMKRLASRVADEATRLSRIVDDLLELSRIELGDDMPQDPIDLVGAIGEAVDRARPLAASRDIRVSVDHGAPAGVRLVGDQRQIVSAIGNLVENAVKYSGEASAIEVRTAEAGGVVVIAVTDHGIGIPARDLDRIFERFYRVDRARSRATGGTGLGLSIVRHVAANHGGTVEVESVEGEGSTFTLRLPIMRADRQSEEGTR